MPVTCMMERYASTISTSLEGYSFAIMNTPKDIILRSYCHRGQKERKSLNLIGNASYRDKEGIPPLLLFSRSSRSIFSR